VYWERQADSEGVSSKNRGNVPFIALSLSGAKEFAEVSGFHKGISILQENN
jgi:hypothetical protein